MSPSSIKTTNQRFNWRVLLSSLAGTLSRRIQSRVVTYWMTKVAVAIDVSLLPAASYTPPRFTR